MSKVIIHLHEEKRKNDIQDIHQRLWANIRVILIVGKNLRGSKRNKMLILDQNEHIPHCM